VAFLAAVRRYKPYYEPGFDLSQFQHFMKNIAIVGGSLAFVALGGGAYSLDVRKP
jgi:uncharacterized membrane protein YphA (DoxX/SURF4 family)